MDKERLYPEIDGVEKALDAFKPGEPNQDAIGAFGRLLYSFEQERDLPPKATEVLNRVRTNFEVLFSSAKLDSYGGWNNIARAIRCDMARLKMVVSMNAEKK
jgi:hypothetical protein